MKGCQLIGACAIALSYASGGKSESVFDGRLGSLKVLKAAENPSSLSKRSLDDAPAYSADLLYADDDADGVSDAFHARFRVESDRPVLNLEEFEHEIKSVTCENWSSSIILTFFEESAAQMIANVVENYSNGTLITSHEGCNDEEERVAYRIQEVAEMRQSGSLALRVQEMPWKKAFKSFAIDFGMARGLDLRRRLANNPRNRSLIPSGDPRAKTVTIELNSSRVNDPLEVPVDFPMETKCQNCTTSGSMKLTQGHFNINTDIFDDLIEDAFGDGENASQIIESGFFDLVMDFAAHIELQSQVKAHFGRSFLLYEAPLAGFHIAGVGKAGILFQADLELGVQLDAPLTLTYGFDAAVPPKSEIRVDLGDIEQSFQRGFDKTTMTLIPLKMERAPLSVTVSSTIRPRIPLSFEFLEVVAETGAFLSLPRLSTTFTQHKSVDANCNPLSPDDVDNTLLGGNFTSIKTELAFELGADLTLKFPSFPLVANFSTATTILATSLPVATSCVCFNGSDGSLPPASVALASASASASASAAADADADADGAAVGRPQPGLAFGGAGGSLNMLLVVAFAITFGGGLVLL